MNGYVMEEANRCFETLSKKYPDIEASEDLQKKVMDIAIQQCLDPRVEMLKKQ